MCRPLKEIVAELEKRYSRWNEMCDLEDRRRIIGKFDKNINYLLSRLEKYEEDVKYVLDNKLDKNIIRRMSLNLVFIMHNLCDTLLQYYNVIEVYLLDEQYEKNRELWSKFSDARQKMKCLSNNLKENNVFEEIPDEIGVLEKLFYDDDNVLDSGMLQLNREEVERMNSAELMIIIDQLLDILISNLDELKNSSLTRDDRIMRAYYERNYLLFAKKYWPAEERNFRPHITNQRLRGKISINELERLRDELAHEFEFHTEIGNIWLKYSEDKTEMAIKMKEQKLDEKQWKYFFSMVFQLEEFDRWIEELSKPQNSIPSLKSFVVKPEIADAVVNRITGLITYEKKPKLIMRPIRAAMDAGVLHRPSWDAFTYEYGEDKIKSSTSFNDYSNPDKQPYFGESYQALVDDFRTFLE